MYLFSAACPISTILLSHKPLDSHLESLPIRTSIDAEEDSPAPLGILP